MIDSLKPLFESGLINEETRASIQAAWDSKINELKSEIRTEIREEFAGRYEHDKAVMVKALDKMVAETLSAEVAQIKEQRNNVTKLRNRTVKEMKQAAKQFEKFAIKALTEEISEFVKERKANKNNIVRLEQFVMGSLAEELREFNEDKKAVAATRVKLIAEAKEKLESLKVSFVQRSSDAVAKLVSESLNAEMKQLHGDIKTARQNNFGRKMFEAFASEYGNNFFNTSKEVKGLKTTVNRYAKKLAEAKEAIAEKENLLEATKKDMVKIQNRHQRSAILSELLAPLSKEKKNVMSQLLESVQTKQLKPAFEKYLPSVLNSKEVSTTKNSSMLNESTGDRVVRGTNADETLSEIKKLAGIK